MEDALHIFEEPPGFRPPTPSPTDFVYQRAHSKGKDLHLTLIGHHSLWSHVVWNAGVFMANYLDTHPEECRGHRFLELGAGAALPSLVATLNGASVTVVTDYPEEVIIDNLRGNIQRNIPDSELKTIHVKGFLWGADSAELLSHTALQKFSRILLCDLVFNHQQHENLLNTCLECLSADGVIYCAFTHHRPWLADKDMNFIHLAQQEPYSLRVEKVFTEKMEVMFEKDPGDVDVRQTVHVFRLTKSE